MLLLFLIHHSNFPRSSWKNISDSYWQTIVRPITEDIETAIANSIGNSCFKSITAAIHRTTKIALKDSNILSYARMLGLAIAKTTKILITRTIAETIWQNHCKNHNKSCCTIHPGYNHMSYCKIIAKVPNLQPITWMFPEAVTKDITWTFPEVAPKAVAYNIAGTIPWFHHKSLHMFTYLIHFRNTWKAACMQSKCHEYL